MSAIIEEHYKQSEKQCVLIADLGEPFSVGNLSKDDLTDTGTPCVIYGELFTTYREIISHVESYTNKSDGMTFSKKGDLLFPSSTTVDAGDINYRFFLGEDITSDFNICRNKSYIVTLDFSQEAGYGELKHEWRVHAKLDEATFLPEGDLVIDGYPQSLGYVPFYVSNGTSGSITLTTTGVSSADMNMYFNQNGYWSGSSAADFGNFKITANSLTEFAIAPNDVGILGEGRNYNQGSFSSADNLNRRDEVAKGDIYNTREYKMTFITNEETKTSVLMVKELPLLRGSQL